MLSRNLKIVSAAGAAVLLTAGGLGATALDKAVTLSVDGTTTETHVFGSTVADVLAKNGITVAAGDRVTPAVDTAIADGDTVNVEYARQLTVTVDGQTRQVSTTERTVDEALAALGLREDGARLSVSRSLAIGRDGLALSLVTPKQISVVVDGKTVNKTITAATVGEALTQLQVKLAKADRVTPAIATPLRDGLAVRVQRVTTKDSTRTETIAFTTTRTSSSSLYEGDTDVRTQGVTGIRTITTRQTLVDGKVAASATVKSQVTRKAVNQVLLVGTKDRPAPTPSAPSTPSTPASPSRPSTSTSTPSTPTTPAPSGAGLNLARAAMWDGIAACESGGNWSINTGNGYYGGLQFLTSTWLGAGGGDFAPRADLASRAEQITVANRLYAKVGTSPWGCA